MERIKPKPTLGVPYESCRAYNLSWSPKCKRDKARAAAWRQLEDPAGRRALFQSEWCAVVDEVPAKLDHIARYWDLAATEKTEFNDPDWTVGIKLSSDRNGGYWLFDMVRQRANPGDIERLLLDTAMQDGKRVRIGFGQDPGQAGKSQAQHLVRTLSGFTVEPARETGDKLTRFGPFSSQCRAGNVKIRQGCWNEELFRVLEGFPDLAHDDEVDACSGALEMLSPPMQSYAAYELMRRQAEEVLAAQQRKLQGASPSPARGSVGWQDLQKSRNESS